MVDSILRSIRRPRDMEMLDHIGRLGLRTEEKTQQLVGMLRLGYSSVKAFALERPRGRRLVLRTVANQIYFTAVEPLPFFALTALIFGFVIIVEADQVLPRYGLSSYVSSLIVTALIREISPLVVAMILIGRSGPAIATELGYMRLNQEVDALDLAGVNIDYFLVLPRVIGVTIATIAVLVAFCAVALVGGFVVGEIVQLISLSLLFRSVIEAITLPMIVYAVLKATMFGVTIAVANCYHGLAVEQSFTEVPKANVRGVQHSLTICFLANALISVYAIL
jgi:phospholipid/cholesterol/gamma-HCH transport system permease protein